MLMKGHERGNILWKKYKEQKGKKMKIEKKVELLENEADTLSLQAEKKESFQTLSKANALRVKAKSVRAEELTAVNQSLTDLENEKVIGGLSFQHCIYV